MSNQNHITDLHIENFKSIKKMDLKPKRINIFVGKPNVGKSNILEALSLNSRYGSIKEVIRFRNIYQLFFDSELSNTIHIETNLISSFISKQLNTYTYDWFMSSDKGFLGILYGNYKADGTANKFLNQYYENIENSVEDEKYDENFNEAFFINQFMLFEDGSSQLTNQSKRLGMTAIKKYLFNEKLIDFKNPFTSFLNTPDGNNLFTILATNKALKIEVSTFFAEYGLELLFDQREQILEVQKRIDQVSYKYDFALVADTLRRIIFYLAAIKSNRDSVLLFEEPEAHCFPPYISQIAQEMIDSKTNQFFVATHSPYLLNTIVANTDYDECAVFVTSYKDYQTHVRELTKDEIGEMLNFGTDVFINYDAFVEE